LIPFTDDELAAVHGVRTPQGIVYGGQFAPSPWAVGENDVRPLVDVGCAPSLWRVSVFGDLLVTVEYGTSRIRRLEGLSTPLVGHFPGSLRLSAIPRNADHQAPVTGLVNLTLVTAAGANRLMRLVSGAQPIPEGVAAVMGALDAPTPQINNRGLGVQTLSQTVPTAIADGSAIVQGSAWLFFEA
jgi:hypothetical protein